MPHSIIYLHYFRRMANAQVDKLVDRQWNQWSATTNCNRCWLSTSGRLACIRLSPRVKTQVTWCTATVTWGRWRRRLGSESTRRQCTPLLKAERIGRRRSGKGRLTSFRLLLIKMSNFSLILNLKRLTLIHNMVCCSLETDHLFNIRSSISLFSSGVSRDITATKENILGRKKVKLISHHHIYRRLDR